MEAEMDNFLSGTIDMMKYMMYCTLEEAEEEKLLFKVFFEDNPVNLVKDTLEDSQKQRRSQKGESRKKGLKGHFLFDEVVNNDDTSHPLQPKDLVLYQMYIANLQPGNK
eukprot:14636243-Ditylum_brightwellii.AAC.1